MTKFLAVVKREYLQRVKSKMFIVATILGPVMIVVFTVVPALIFSLKAGGATRLAIVDQTGKMYERVRESLLSDRRQDNDSDAENSPASTFNSNTQDQMNEARRAVHASYSVEQVETGSRDLDAVRKELKERVLKDQLDGYIVLPPDVLESGKVMYRTRNTGDVITTGEIKDRLNRAIRDQRMSENNVSQALMEKINKPIELSTMKADETSGQEDSGGVRLRLHYRLYDLHHDNHVRPGDSCGRCRRKRDAHCRDAVFFRAVV